MVPVDRSQSRLPFKSTDRPHLFTNPLPSWQCCKKLLNLCQMTPKSSILPQGGKHIMQQTVEMWTYPTAIINEMNIIKLSHARIPKCPNDWMSDF